MSNPTHRQVSKLQNSGSSGASGKRRHSRLSFLPRVASEVSEQSGLKQKDRYRVVVMGSARVGKTAIVKQFLYETFPEEHHATVEELHKTEYDVKEIGQIGVEVLDTSGSFSFPAMNRLAIASGDAFVLAYAVNDKESFEEVKRLRDLICQVKEAESGSNQMPPVVIAGNKSDLEDERVIGKEMSEFECIDWEVGFIECSAKNNERIYEIFQQLLLQAHLKGTLKSVLKANVKFSPTMGGGNTSLTSSTSGSEPPRNNQRRRSSLPINDLFHHHMSLGNFRHHGSRSPSRKRNSCAMS